MSKSIKLNEKFQKIEQEMNGVFVERSSVIRGLLLSTISKTNILLLGTPGTAKSQIINRWNQHITDSKFFSWLLTRFSTPEELFGPFSMQGLKEDKFVRATTGKLPEANTAFIDEIFKASSGMLNSMLSVMNERVFYNGDKAVQIPLFTLAGASNEIPEKEDRLDAIYDRFLLKYNVMSIQEDSNFAKMLKSRLDISPDNTLSLTDILEAQDQAAAIVLTDEVIDNILKIRTELHNQAVMISDRAFKQMGSIIKAEAWLNGRTEATIDDLEILQHTCWQDPDTIRKVQLLILDVIAPERYKIQELFNNSMDIVAEFWKVKDSKKKADRVIETGHKLKEAKTAITKYCDELRRKGKVTKEAEEMLVTIDAKLREIYMKVLGVEIG